MRADQAIYLYCIADRGLGEEVTLPGGIENQTVEVVEHGGTHAVFSTLPRSLFQGEEAESNLQDIAWITPRAAAHDEVIKRVIEQTAVYPLPFGTLFSSLDRVREEMDSKLELIQEVFTKVEGCHEWGVRILLDRKAAVENLVEQEIAEQGVELSDSQGTRHMQMQRLRRDAKQRLAGELKGTLVGYLELLRDHTTEEMARKNVLATDSSGLEGLAHWSFLVEDKSQEDFVQSIKSISEQAKKVGLHLTVSGPWPPYSFCSPDPGSS